MTRMMLSQLNITYIRSKVKHRARIVEVAKLIDIGWTDKFSSNDDLNQLKPLVIGPSDPNTSVNNVKADLVVLLTTGNNWPADEHGIAFKCATPPCTVVKFNSATDRRYTFTHEVGHLLCGGHEDDLTPFSKAYKDSANLFRTVIHQAPAESNRILNYSNPYVKYSSKPTGTKYQYNACVIQNSGCGMAGFNEPNECTINAKGKFDSECNPTTIKVTASMLPTTCNAQNYKFEYTIDGFNYYTSCPFTSNNYCDIYLLIFPNRSSITVKITAYGNGTQVIGYLFKTFTTLCPETPMQLPGYLKKIDNNGSIKSQSSSYLSRLAQDNANPEEINCSLFDLNGKLIISGNIDLLNELEQLNKTYLNISSGVYFLQIKEVDKLLYNSKIIVK